jgi:DNA-binding NarL/FixJ family response regulator
MTHSITVAVIDDHALVREGLRLLLEREPDVTVVGEAGTSAEAFALVDRTSPQIALVDLTLGESEGIALIRGLGVRYPKTMTVALTMHRDGETVREALLAGASGYLVKGASRAELVAAIHAVAQGEAVCPLSRRRIVVGDSLQWLRHGQRRPARRGPPPGGGREDRRRRQAGAQDRAHTVRRHVANLTAKLASAGAPA